jgi:hypothetical protein
MTLKLKVTADEFEGLDEGIKGLYEERDGEYALPVEGIEDTGGLKSALEKERKAAREASKRLKDYEGLGLSAEEIAQLKEAQRQAEEDKAKKSGEWEKLKGQMQEKHQQEIKAREEKVDSMRKALESYLVDAQATSAISAAKGNAKLLLPHVKSAVQVIEEDGEYKVQVMGKDGPRVNGKGEFLTIAELVEEMKSSEDFGMAFAASGATGGGAPASGGSRPGNTGKFTISAEDAKDFQKYVQVRNEAAKVGQTVEIIR